MPTYQSRLTIDLEAVTRNYKTLCAKVGTGCEVATAVKANAYGLGIEKVAPVLKEAGCQSFYVATLDEGIQLRSLFGPDTRILMLNGFWVNEMQTYLDHDISPVLSSIEQVEYWQNANTGKLKAALQIDTGINRLGVPWKEMGQLTLNQGRGKIDLILSHFASADNPNIAQTEEQFNRFRHLIPSFENVRFSISNSFGIYAAKRYHLDQVRSGMAIFGLNPTPGRPNPMHPAVELQAQILQIQDVKGGETCGYGATYKLPRNSRLATIGIGYGDGFPLHLSNSGTVYWVYGTGKDYERSYPCSVLGRVSMDLTIIDLTDIPSAHEPQPGDWVEIIGPRQSADELAKDAGTIGYEILTSLGARHARFYID